MDDSNTELNLHANMIVLGKHSFVFEWLGKSCTVNPFNDFLGSVNNVPILNAAIYYDFTYSHESYIPLCINVLYLPNM